MHPYPHQPPVDVRLTEAEAIAVAYHRAARGDAWTALVTAVADALIDLDEAEKRLGRQDRLISRGYARWGGGPETEQAGAVAPGPVGGASVPGAPS